MATDHSLDDARANSLGRLLLNAHRTYTDRFITLISELGYGRGITMAHVNIIAFLPTDGIRITALAEQTQMTKQTVGQFVHELEVMGLLERAADPKDKRAVIIRFTELGHHIMVDSLRIKDQVETEFRDLMGEAHYSELIEGLRVILSTKR